MNDAAPPQLAAAVGPQEHHFPGVAFEQLRKSLPLASCHVETDAEFAHRRLAALPRRRLLIGLLRRQLRVRPRHFQVAHEDHEEL